MYLHFLHLERVQLLLDPLSECGREPAPRRGLAAAVIHSHRSATTPVKRLAFADNLSVYDTSLPA